jgi:hypothetical protein
MKTDTVKAIFTNFLFVIGIILLIYGFVQGSLTAVRMITFEKYPLNSYEETRCNMEYFARSPEESAPSEAQIAAQRAECLESIDHDRRVRKTEHIVTSMTTFVAGALLVISFRRFIYK